MPIWTGARIAAPLLILIGASAARADRARCADRLVPRYGDELATALRLTPSTAPTLAAEPGSVAEGHPPVIRALRELARDFVATPLATVRRADQRLDAVARATADPRLIQPLASLRARVAHVRALIDTSRPEHFDGARAARGLEAHVWELLVACLMRARKIHLGVHLAALYPGHFGPHYAREVDVAIELDDGSWRWIEVKNWTAANARKPRHLAALVSQGRAVALARHNVPHLRVAHELVMRHGLPVGDYVTALGAYDRVSFVFPDVTASDVSATSCE